MRPGTQRHLETGELKVWQDHCGGWQTRAEHGTALEQAVGKAVGKATIVDLPQSRRRFCRHRQHPVSKTPELTKA